MRKIKIRIFVYSPLEINKSRLLHWKSQLFEIIEIVENQPLNMEMDTNNNNNWYGDNEIQRILPVKKSEDIFIGVANIRIQNNFISRVYEDNKVFMTFFDLYEKMESKNIPYENLILRLIYSYSIIFYVENELLVKEKEFMKQFNHDIARRCIFDNCIHKSDILDSTIKPQICDDCKDVLKDRTIPENLLNSINKELKKIDIKRYYRISNYIKKHPIISIIFSFLSAILIGLISSYIYNLIGESFN